MDIRPIRDDLDHQAAVREIERLWDAPEGSPEADRLEVLATLVDDFESRRWPIENGSPRDMLLYAVTDMGHSQSESADLLGSRSQACDLLSGRRHLSLPLARKISATWSIPIALLVTPYEDDVVVASHDRL